MTPRLASSRQAWCRCAARCAGGLSSEHTARPILSVEIIIYDDTTAINRSAICVHRMLSCRPPASCVPAVHFNCPPLLAREQSSKGTSSGTPLRAIWYQARRGESRDICPHRGGTDQTQARPLVPGISTLLCEPCRPTDATFSRTTKAASAADTSASRRPPICSTSCHSRSSPQAPWSGSGEEACDGVGRPGPGRANGSEAAREDWGDR